MNAVRPGMARLPEWQRIEAAFRGVFERRYFANNGPLVRALDDSLPVAMGVVHAVCVTNGTVALILLAASLTSAQEKRGEVIVPAFAPSSTLHAVQWAGLVPVLADVDAETHGLSAGTVSARITPDTVAICGVHRWGIPCDVDGLTALAAQRGIPLLFDGREAAGAQWRGRDVGAYGAGTAFSFHVASVLGAGEGGFVATNDATVADRLRTMRNFRPSETFAPVTLRTNGKMSEAQAAMGLLAVEDMPRTLAANAERVAAYAEGLRGVGLLQAPDGAFANGHSVVITVAPAKRDRVVGALAAAGMTAHMPEPLRGAERFAVADRLNHTVLQLPSGPGLSLADIGRICAAVRGGAA